jgi:hypothetical protein
MNKAMVRRRLVQLGVLVMLVASAFGQGQYFGQNGEGNGHAVRTINNLKACLFENTSGAGVLTEIGINVYAAATGRIRLGVYADSGSDVNPGALLLDAGEVVNPVAGWNSIKNLRLAVEAGKRYWLAWQNNVGIDVYHNTGFYFSYAAFLYAPFPASFGAGALQAVRTSVRALVVPAALKPPPLTAGFMMRPCVPREGRPIQFTDYSRGSVVSWLWDFGDGTTSAEQNPVHTYVAAGEYTISMTISDGITITTAQLRRQ